MKKRLLICALCVLAVLSFTLSTYASDEASMPDIQLLNHRVHEGLELFEGYIFSDGNSLRHKNNDMFYNVSDNGYSYNRWAKTMYSYWTENADGSFTRVEPQAYRVHYRSSSGVPYYDREQGEFIFPDWDSIHYSGPNNIIVETYSAGIELISSKTIPMPLPIFGGFFSGDNYNFVVVGQENPNASDSVEVLRFLKYSKDWELLGSQSVYGANTTIPFDAGCLRMTEVAGYLYVHTSHEMYSGHQANMTFVLNQADMTIKEQLHKVWNISGGYVSHSFNQFIDTDGSYIYRVDHGDAYPRSVVVTRSAVGGRIDSVSYKDAFAIKQGSVGNNDTGVAIGGFAIGNNNLIIAGETEDQENSENFGNLKYNIFLSVMKKDLSAVDTVMLTNYGADSTVGVLPPQLVKIDGNHFLVLWEECDTTDGSVEVCSVAVDENGKKVSDIVRNPMRLSDCQPVLCSDGTVKWYVSTGARTVLYSLPTANLNAPLLYGDVDRDGYVGPFDALLVLKYDAQTVSRLKTVALADVNQDGEVTALDASLILQYDAKLIPAIPF